MSTFFQKRKFKNQQLAELQRQIWDYEIRIEIQRKFLKDTEIKVDMFQMEIKTLEEGVKQLAESTKYEDRKLRQEKEEELKTWRERLKGQEDERMKAQIIIQGGKIGDKIIIGLEQSIEQNRQKMAIINELL